MFEKFTGPARRVVVLAQEEARGLGHNYIGAEHLLLGLLGEQDGVAAAALQILGGGDRSPRSGRGDRGPRGASHRWAYAVHGAGETRVGAEPA